MILYDYKAAARVWQYDPVAKRFSVLSDTNLLKTTGGTLNGQLNVNAPLFLNSKDGVKQYSFETDANGKLWFTEKNTPKDIFTVETDGTFRVAGSTNLLKKTGDTMTGDLQINTPNKGFKVGNGVEGITQMVDTNGRYYWYSTLAKTPFYYDIKTDNFVVSAPNTNLLKKTGDTMTGTLIMANDKFLTFSNASGAGSKAFKQYPDNRFAFRDLENGVDIFSVVGGKFNVNVDSNLVTKTKDGRATLTPTADAELIGANGIIADRRGNAVHLRVPARLKVGATGSVVTTLPVDMRPTMTFLHNIISNDGKVARLTINTDGTVAFSQISSTQITGADFYVSVSYVVD